MSRPITLLLCTALGLLAAGCSTTARLNLAERTGGSAALFGQFQAYDGQSGRKISFADVVGRCRPADVILFGEKHSDVVCNELEAQLLVSLAQQDRPIALAMEFFEADTQPALDAYLTGKLEEESFREMSRQNTAYLLAHRPLIEICRAAHLPVIAANVPSRLRREYSKAGSEFEAFRQSVRAEDRRWLPREVSTIRGPYRDRFFELMSSMPAHGAPPQPEPREAPATQPATQPHQLPATRPAPTAGEDVAPGGAAEGEAPGGSAHAAMTAVPPPAQAEPSQDSDARAENGRRTRTLEATAEGEAAPAAGGHSMQAALERAFRVQLMWDATMAENIADHRAAYPHVRVMLVVGSFHVAGEGGTLVKLREQRPRDRIVTILYEGDPGAGLEMSPELRGQADIVLIGVTKPPRRE